jgi:hypothetical protein
MMTSGIALNSARQLADVTVYELWLRYFTLGGTASRADLGALLRGDLVFRADQYDIVAHAINERFVELDMNHPVPYAGDDN